MVARDDGNLTTGTLQQLLDSGSPYTLVFIGITGFDNASLAFGSSMLQALTEVVSRRITRCVRNSDDAIAIDQGEFVIAMPGAYDAEAYRSLQERIRSAVEAEIVLQGNKARLSTGFGCATYPEDGATYDEVLEHAKAAMLRTQRSRLRAEALEQEAEAARESEEAADALAGSTRAHVDDLTGLPDALYFRRRASEIVRDAQASPQGSAENLAVVFCDIEKFKEYNLKYGYDSGDDLLKFLADTLETAFPGDLIARLNSDRFGILTRSTNTAEIMEDIHDKVRRFRINSSIELKAGICELKESDYSATKAQDYARLACDSIKGRYDYFWRRFDDKLASEVQRRQHIVDNLDAAISSGWIEVFYQPIVRGVTGKICGMEALTRWNDPTFGMLPPGEFIDVLEDAHLIHRLDICMVKKVCQDGRAIIDAGRKAAAISINLSRLDYQLCDIFSVVDSVVTESGFPKSLLHIEFTETAFTQDAEYFHEVIGKFRDAGYGVWMDDFGSGYSSLNLLKDFNFDVLKIDMEFLRGLEESPRTRDIIASVVDMAKKLGIQTLAEGVETQEQFAFLKSIGCEMMQGYLFARPSRFDDVLELIDGGTLEVEDTETQDYYRAIGQVNMMSPSPFEQADARTNSLEFSSGIPLAIIEEEDGIFRIVVSNDSFVNMIEASNLADVVDDVVVFTKQGAKLGAELYSMGVTSRETGQDQYVDFYDFKQLYTARVLFIAETSKRKGYLMSLNSYSTSSERDRAQARGALSTDRMVYLPVAQETPWQTSAELDLARSAILVIDILGGTEGITPGLEEMAANSVAIVKAARAAGIPIIFNNDSHIAGLDQELELWGDHGVRGTQSGTPLAEFEVAESDFIIPKRRYNGFFQTDLELTLRELGVDTVIALGCDTNICVSHTLAGAYFYGFKSVVPSDATGTFLIGTQEEGLQYLSRMYDTRIVTTADILDRIDEFKNAE